MKIEYGKENIRGRIVFDVIHKFAKGWSTDDQMSMVMRTIIKKYEDAERFNFYVNNSENERLCGQFYTGTDEERVLKWIKKHGINERPSPADLVKFYETAYDDGAKYYKKRFEAVTRMLLDKLERDLQQPIKEG